MSRFIACLILALLAEPSVAQEQSSFAKYAVNSLFNKEVQKELELVEDQKTEIAKQLKRLTSFRDQLSEQLGGLKADGASEQQLTVRREEMLKELEVEKGKVQRQVFKVLLPHQAARLKEISAQFAIREAMKQKSVPTGLLTPSMLEYLDIQSDQAKRIKERSTEIRQQLTEKIKKLNEAAIKELMQELKHEQREKYKKLMGQRFVQ